MDHVTVAIISIASIVITALIGVVYRSLSSEMDKKVDKEMYAQAIEHIRKAVDGINGTATTLKGVVESVADIHNKYLTKTEHEYMCKLHAAKLENDALRRDGK